MPSTVALRSTRRDRDVTPPVSTLRPPRFRGPPKPPSQQTPPSAQRPPNSQSQQTVVPSSMQPSQQSSLSVAEDADPIEEFSEYELPAASPRASHNSQNAFQKMASSRASASSQRRTGPMNPKWSDKEDEILIKGIRQGWSAFEIARELEQNGKRAVQRTDSAIRGRKKALVQKYNLQPPAPASPAKLRVEKRQRWTPAELSTLTKGVRDGLDAVTLHQEKFPYRSLRSVEHKVLKRKHLCKDPIVPRRKAADVLTPNDSVVESTQVDDTPNGNTLNDDDLNHDTLNNDTVNEDILNDDLPDNTPNGDIPENLADDDYDMTDGSVPNEVVPESDAEEQDVYQMLDDDFDMASVPTAFVKLPASASPKPGRLRSVKKKKAGPRRKPTETQAEPTETQLEPAETQAEPTETRAEPMETQVEPKETQAGATDDRAHASEPDSEDNSGPVPKDQRKPIFHDWDPEARWRDCLERCGGDVRAARRMYQDVNLTTRMFDAILYKDYVDVDNIKGERQLTELRWAIEDGRARRIRPADPDLGDADDEVIRVDDWEIFKELEEDDDMDMMEDRTEMASSDDLESEEDIIRDQEIEETEDDDDEAAPADDMIHDREIEEVEDDEEEALPIVDHHRTPVQAMRAMVVDDGLPTPLPTNEKVMAFGIDSKQPSSSLPTVPPSDITMTSTRDSELSTKSKRQLRRIRSAGRRRSSGRDRKKSRNSVRETAARRAAEKATLEAPSSSYGVEENNPFMDIVRNAHIPSPPRRRAASPRRRGTPSPPAWFMSNDDEDDSDTSSEESD